ncbi:hypothetical protein ABTY61_15330 [Kitasatospora sp. NPDC096128]|uniref:hypothetical protein n=1 Tax=Kitasatospora sp. NPDC096128 TaxID=3155547 RepID=UPI00331A3D0E
MSDQNPFGPPQADFPAPPPATDHGYGVPPQAPPPGYPGAPGAAGAYPPYYGGYAPVPPPRRSHRTLWIVLGTIGAVVLLGGGALAYAVWDATNSAGTQKVVLPETFQDLTRDNDSAVTAEMERSMAKSFGQGDGAWNPIGVAGVYQDAQSRQQLIVAGGYGKVLLPKEQLDQAFAGAGGGKADAITQRHTVDAGPKGGTMECAVMTRSNHQAGLCVWADSSSVILVGRVPAPGTRPDLDKLATDTRELRAVAEVPK